MRPGPGSKRSPTPWLASSSTRAFGIFTTNSARGVIIAKILSFTRRRFFTLPRHRQAEYCSPARVDARLLQGLYGGRVLEPRQFQFAVSPPRGRASFRLSAAVRAMVGVLGAMASYRQLAVAAMSHSEALPRLTIGDWVSYETNLRHCSRRAGSSRPVRWGCASRS